MRQFDIETLIDGIDDDIYAKFFLEDNKTVLDKKKITAEIRQLEQEFHSQCSYGGDSYTAFVDGIDFFITAVFPVDKEAEIYREKAYRIINDIKAGSNSLDKLEDLAKIFISIMRCSSNWLMEEHDKFEFVTLDSDFEFTIYSEDFELLNRFGNYSFERESERKGFLGIHKKELFNEAQHVFIIEIITFLMFRIFQFEGQFAEEEPLDE